MRKIGRPAGHYGTPTGWRVGKNPKVDPQFTSVEKKRMTDWLKKRVYSKYKPALRKYIIKEEELCD